MSLRPVYIESVGYLCGHGHEGDRCASVLARDPNTDDSCISSEAMRAAGMERRVRTQISEHALFAVLAAKRCAQRAQLSAEELAELALFLGVPSGSEVGYPFLEAVREGLAYNPSLTRADVFEARSINVLDLLRLSTGNTAGHVARTLGLHGPNACYIGGQSTFFALSRAHRAISSGGMSRALVVGGESVAARDSKVFGPRAGCAVLLTSEPGVDREELELLSFAPPEYALAAPFACFESLNTLLNLALLLEGKRTREAAYIEERDLADQRRVFGVRRPALSDPQISTIRLQTTLAVDRPRRVVITAAGLVTPLGRDFRTFAEALFSGTCAARSLVDVFGREWEGLPVSTCAPISDFVPRTVDNVQERVPNGALERSAQFALDAVGQIVDQVGVQLLRETRAPLYCGVGAAQPLLDFDEARRLCEGTDAQPRRSAEACELGSQVLRTAYGLTGAAQTFAGACSASTQACIQAAEEIRAGLEVAVIAGGHDSLLSTPGLYMMHELGTLSTGAEPSRAVRPFDRDRDGTMVGEGAVYFLFEELEHAKARGALILAEVSGWGSSLDGHHITSPDPEGTHGVAMIRAALSLASIGPERVDYVNAHGTATLLNDATEARILQQVMGEHSPWVSSSKAQLGHLIAACGAVELAVCVAALMHQRLPPNLNLETRDPECELKLVTSAQAVTLDYVLSNSFGFGGQNSCMLLKRFCDAD